MIMDEEPRISHDGRPGLTGANIAKFVQSFAKFGMRTYELFVDIPDFYLCAINFFIMIILTELFLLCSISSIAASADVLPKIVPNATKVINLSLRFQ